MANFDKTVDKNGQEWMWLCGKWKPCRTLSPGESLRDPIAFQKNLERIRKDVRQRLARSEIACRYKFLD